MDNLLRSNNYYNTCIKQFLSCCEWTIYHYFNFIRQLIFYVLFYPPQHERFQDHVQPRQVF